MNVSRRSWSRWAVVANTAPELRISDWSWPRRSLSASNTTPVLLMNWFTAPCWESSTRISLFASSAKGSRLAIAADRSEPRPSSARAACCIQVWNAARVRSSKVRKISSSWTASETCAWGRVPSSGRVGASSEPGVSSM
jgi:hypothetical protein